MQYVPWKWQDSCKKMTRKYKEFQEIQTSELKHLIDEYVHNKRYREILYSHFIDGETFESIAEKFELSTTRIKTIVYKYGDKVLSYLSIVEK